MNWELYFTRDACKDAKKIHAAGLQARVDALLRILRVDPFQNSPPYEKLVGDLDGDYSRRINLKHRLVYQVIKAERAVKILRMWSYYE